MKRQRLVIGLVIIVLILVGATYLLLQRSDATPIIEETQLPAASSLPNPATHTPDDTVVCTQQYDPVCGTDGTTYSNRCVAEQQEHIPVAYVGPCRVEPY